MIFFKNANEKMKSELISAMCECFNEPVETVQFFFENKFNKENCFVCVKDGVVAAVLHVLPQTLAVSGSFYRSYYVYGACTLPQFRSRGYMSKLLRYTEAVLKVREADFTVLVPENKKLEGFYGHLGYRNFFKTKTVFLTKKTMKEISKSKVLYQMDCNILKYSVEELRYCAYKDFNGMVYTQKDIDYAFNLYKKFGGEAVFSKRGYAICVPVTDSVLEIKDFTCADFNVPELVSEILLKFPNYKRFIIKTNPANTYFNRCKSDKFYGMIKPLRRDTKDIIKNLKKPAYLGLALD